MIKIACADRLEPPFFSFAAPGGMTDEARACGVEVLDPVTVFRKPLTEVLLLIGSKGGVVRHYLPFIAFGAGCFRFATRGSKGRRPEVPPGLSKAGF